MASPQSALHTHLYIAAAVAHMNLALYHRNLSVALSSRVAMLPLQLLGAKNVTNKEQQTESVDEMLLSKQTVEMFSRLKDMSLTKLEERESDLHHRLTSCASPLSQEGVLLGAFFEAEDDKDKRALLQDTLLLIMLVERHLFDPTALDQALLELFANHKYDSLWRSRFHNSFAKLVGPSWWTLKSKRKNADTIM